MSSVYFVDYIGENCRKLCHMDSYITHLNLDFLFYPYPVFCSQVNELCFVLLYIGIFTFIHTLISPPSLSTRPHYVRYIDHQFVLSAKSISSNYTSALIIIVSFVRNITMYHIVASLFMK